MHILCLPSIFFISWIKRVSSRDFPEDFAVFYYYQSVFSTLSYQTMLWNFFLTEKIFRVINFFRMVLSQNFCQQMCESKFLYFPHCKKSISPFWSKIIDLQKMGNLNFLGLQIGTYKMSKILLIISPKLVTLIAEVWSDEARAGWVVRRCLYSMK